MTAVTARAPAARPNDWLIRQLPAGMLGEDFFVRFVSLFQAEADTLLSHADALPYLADYRMAPLDMARWLGSWIGATGIDASMPDAVQRSLVAAAARVLNRRGTTSGLRTLLEAWTGGDVHIEESGGVVALGEPAAGPAWVVVWVATSGHLEPRALADLVRDEIPAHLAAEFWIGEDRMWTSGVMPERLFDEGGDE